MQNHTTAFIDILGNERVFTDEPMKLHTTFRIGGPADYFLTPGSVEELKQILAYCRKAELPSFILGNGSNLLVSDEGFRGVVIRIFRAFQELQIEGEKISVGAGILMSTLASAARDASLTGLEFASGIPGTLGGGIVMNAGAYGGELKDVLTEVTVLDEEGEVRVIPAKDCALGYRTSILKEKGWIALAAGIRLKQGDREAIRARMEELKEARTSKQPLEYPSAGSTFKRPEGYFAGKLIQDAGLRGYRVGDAQVSEKHCGFVINRGNAAAADVMQLIRDVRSKVWDMAGVLLEPEIKTLGDFPGI